ncbi:MAG: DUF1579 family protein [Ignavibacteriales bacterium]|nr:DUF1579 family protein [Ignavibacteriales bacterium]
MTLLFVIILTGFSFAQTDAEMKAYMEYLTPGEMHEYLTHAVGDWDYALKIWTEPGKEPTVNKGTAKGEMLLGGRFLQISHDGVAWGMPMPAITLSGFENFKKEFQALWTDNMGTGFSLSTGTMNSVTKNIVMYGSFIDAVQGETKFKGVWNFADLNNHSIKMFTLKDGKEILSWETIYTKKN